MKIGIMTMQRVPNYGSFLQAYGLSMMIRSMGQEVVFIDIPKGEEILNSPMMPDNDATKTFAQKFIQYMAHPIKYLYYREKHKNFFSRTYKDFLSRYMNIGPENCNESCDVLVVGSDEVFNCLNRNIGFNLALFGEYPNAKRVITYAASCGWTKYEFLNNEQITLISKTMKKLRAISVRDQNTFQFVEKLTEYKPCINLDPVLVSDFKDFMFEHSDSVPRDKYVLIYAYYNRIENKKEIQAIKRFARELNCKIVALGAPQFWCDEYLTVDPKEIFAIFRGAEFIITDTFHGVIISAKVNKQFTAIVRISNKNKLKDLLERLKLESRICTDITQLSEIYRDTFDYSTLNEQLNLERKKSLDYISKYINVQK